jgi:hypothetical protein
MKYFITLLACTFSLLNGNALAGSEVYKSSNNDSIVVQTDGRSTYIQAIPGLIIRGATFDGDRLIIAGQPQEIKGWKDGKAITLSRADKVALNTQPSVDSDQLKQRLNEINTQLAKLMSGPTASNSVASVPAQEWEIKPDDMSIYTALRRWGQAAQWQVTWEIPVDFPVTITDKFQGNFEDAVTRVVTAYEGSDYPPKACFYQNRVVRIIRLLGNGKECEIK